MARKKVAKKLKRVKSPREEKNGAPDVCFVIMPFGGWVGKYYDEIYLPAIDSAGLEPHRADDLFRPSTTVNDIWAYTASSKSSA